VKLFDPEVDLPGIGLDDGPQGLLVDPRFGVPGLSFSIFEDHRVHRFHESLIVRHDLGGEARVVCMSPLRAA
jgi:hypothetical protein